MKKSDFYIDTTDATVALADARGELVKLRGALEPNPDAVHARVAAATADLQKHAPRTATLAGLEAHATGLVERELFDALVKQYAAAERAVNVARDLVQHDETAMDAIPSFFPERTQGQSDTAHQVAVLRAELTLRDVRGELRELPVPRLIDAHKQAHAERDWLTATAADAELRRLLRGIGKGLGDAATMVQANTHAVKSELERARQERRALVDIDSAHRAQTNAQTFDSIDKELRQHDGLLFELRKARTLPLRVALKGR